MVAAVTDDPDEQPATENAFLIYPSNQVQSLEDHMFTIGSGPENDLQLDDYLVEKQHAQLRLIGDHYVVFDLDTTHGTLVNQQKIRQHTLRPGDVLIFGSTRIIYGENHHHPVDQTQEYIPPSNGFSAGMDEST
jgi:pSer/pThr/pTyr-binding forkhead associated (FHA) protein